MPLLSLRSRRFLDSFRDNLASFKEAAKEAQLFTEGIADQYGHAIHAVKARAKDVASLREKLRRKNYRKPDAELTDLIGVRVITYFAADVDVVADALAEQLEISVRKSRDARSDLDVDRFGYRSLHLIARLRPRDARQGANKHLQRKWFEIQVRSILDHAWAEIEHETVYKAAVEFPPEVKRRFRAVAGALEVIESVFTGLTEVRDELVDQYKAAYAAGGDQERIFDVARLIAFMETAFPSSPSLRDNENRRTVLQSTQSGPLVSALVLARAHNARRLQPVFSGRRFRESVKQLAAETGSAPDQVSHRARVILATALLRPAVVKQQFPDLFSDPALSRIASVDL